MSEPILRFIKARVHGKVQGVFYRVTTQEQAMKLGLNGTDYIHTPYGKKDCTKSHQ